jgi:hypothetical protein
MAWQTQEDSLRPLHGVMSGTRIRQKFAKKRSLHGVNEHFSRIFNAIIVPRSNRAKVSRCDNGPENISGLYF